MNNISLVATPDLSSETTTTTATTTSSAAPTRFSVDRETGKKSSRTSLEKSTRGKKCFFCCCHGWSKN